jgi:hypothetical protein
MHLGGAAEFSTFRRTLAAILRPVLGLDTEDDPKLSAWISTHLGVNSVPVPDPDRLAEAETAVLDLLDPPLNLRGRPPTRSVSGWPNYAAVAGPTRPSERRRHRRAAVSN